MNASATVNQHKDKTIEKLARAGMGAKGATYLILGVLTAMAAFNQGGQKADKNDALKFLYEQPFGKVLLVLLTIGLIGYVIWRFVQAFRDPENEGSDKNGIALRIGYGLSGILYGTLAYEAIKMLAQSGSSGGGGQQRLIGTILQQPFGQILVGIIAVAFFVKGVYQIYKAYSGKFKKKIKSTGLDHRVQDLVMKAGKVGHTARGIVIAIVAYSLMRAAIEANPSEANGTKGAFDFIQSSSYGSWLLGLVAVGLACYGVFMIVKARYRVMPSNM